ncbi:MAG: hypothetical protein FWH35_00920, partial [Treponema sp.]|nr:hypothetical protein [Treponema sp.]
MKKNSFFIWRATALLVAAIYVMGMHPVLLYAEEAPIGMGAELESVSVEVKAGEGGRLELGEAEIEIPPGALGKDTVITIKRLPFTAGTGENLANVTAGGGGYRFEPAGTVFKKPVTIKMGYDSGLSKDRVALEDLYTYYYDTKGKAWERLEKAGLEEWRHRVISKTTHFTDMINGTLKLPEGPEPLSFNINSIKGLEAANPMAGIPVIEGLEGDNSGAAGFRIALPLPQGHLGMTPRVGITYSSDSPNGVMGKGFELDAGGRVSTDTRWGIPEYNNSKDTYLLNGVLLEEQSRTASEINYKSLRDSTYEQIKRNIPGNYWEATDREGRTRTYGKGNNAWHGKGADRYTWELEEESDIYGNKIIYTYSKQTISNETRELHLGKIEYSGGAYAVEFGYESGRNDARVDGRGRYAENTDKLLTGIKIIYDKTRLLREYRMEYEENIFGVKQLKKFGELAADKTYRWGYSFEYEKEEYNNNGTVKFFDARKPWGAIDHGIAVQGGTGSGGNGSLSFGIGVGTPAVDVRGTAGAHFSSSSGNNYTKALLMDINGDGRPDSVWRDGGALKWRENLNGSFSSEIYTWENNSGLGMPKLNREKSSQTAIGYNLYGGLGFSGSFLNLGASYAETTQSGTTDGLSGLMDMDGNGFADIVQSGEESYLRNTGAGFAKGAISTAPGVKLDNSTIIDPPDLEGLEGQFYVQSPFRSWRAPYKGVVRIEERMEKGNASREGNIYGRTFHGKENLSGNGFFVNGDNPVRAMAFAGQRPEKGSSFYFVSDTGGNTLYGGIKWNIKIEYESLALLDYMDATGNVYIPVKDAGEYEEKQPVLEASVFYSRETRTVTLQGGIIKEYYRYKSKEPNWEIISGPYIENYTKGIINLIKGGFCIIIPGTLTREGFNALRRKIPEAGRQGYEDALLAYYEYDSGLERYVINEENRLRTSDKSLWQALEDKIYALAERCSEEERESFITYKLPDGTEINPLIYGIGENISFERKGGPFTYNRRLTGNPGAIGPGYIDIDKIDGKQLRYYPNGNYLTLGGEPYGSAAWGKITEEDETGKTKELGEGLEIDFTHEGTTRYTQRYIFSNKKEGYSISRDEYENFRIAYYGGMEASLFYALGKPYKETAEAGIYDLTDEWESILSMGDGEREAYFAAEYGEDKEEGYIYSKGIYQNLVKFIANNGKEYYETVERGIRYNTAGLYPVTKENTVEMLALDENRNRFTILSVGKKTAWDSLNDFTGEEKAGSGASFTRAISPLELKEYEEEVPEGATLDLSNLSITIEMSRAEALYGGKNEWYYGLWHGDSREFNEEELYRLKFENLGLKTEDETKAMQEKIRRKNKQGLAKEDMEREAYIKLQRKGDYKEEERDNVLRNVIESGSGRFPGDNALIGRVATYAVLDEDENGIDRKTIERYYPYIEGDYIHADRFGGPAFYETPGVKDLYLPGSHTGMVDLNKSKSKYTDITRTAEAKVNIGSGYSSIIQLLSEFSLDVSLDSDLGIKVGPTTLAVTDNKNEGGSEMYHSVMDMNGDGIPDIVRRDGEGIKYNPGRRAAGGVEYGGEVSMAGGGPLRSYTNEAVSVLGGSTSAGGTFEPKIGSRGNVKTSLVHGFGGGAGITFSRSESIQNTGLADINGDGLPDYIAGNTAGLNIDDAFRGSLFTNTRPLLSTSTNRSAGISMSFSSSGEYKEVAQSDILGFNFSAGGGISFSVSSNSPDRMLLDINGDGLPDLIEKNNGKYEVYINLGSKFAPAPIAMALNGWDITTGEMNAINLKSDGSMLGSFFEEMPVIGTLLAPTGFFLLFGDDMGFIKDPFAESGINGLEYTNTATITLTGSANGGGTVSIFLVAITINLTGSANLGLSANNSISNTIVSMVDMDGDGLPDRVLRVPGSNTIYVQKNLLGRVGLLRKIALPGGGSYSLDYEWMTGTTKMPQGKYVLSALSIHDGKDKGLIAQGDGSEHTYKTTYKYGDGYYDRDVKEFYGFRDVTSTDAYGNETTTRYANDSYVHKGMVLSRTVRDSGQTRSYAEYVLDSLYPRIKQEAIERYERYGDGSKVEKRAIYEYASYGNITRMTETSSGVDEVRVDITYKNNFSYYLHNHPVELKAYNNGRLIRWQQADYTNQGSIQRLRQYSNEGGSEYGESRAGYYANGNLRWLETQINKDNALRVEYVYDTQWERFVETIKRSGTGTGEYTSKMEWDKGFGLKTAEIDENSQRIEYAYDPYGRLIEVWSPYDSKGGKPSVRHEYYNGSGNWHAVTYNKVHFDSSDASTMATF